MDTWKSPHKAVLQITIDVMDVKPTGECSGRPLKNNELSEFGLKTVMTRTINGFDRQDCLTKLKRLIESLETK